MPTKRRIAKDRRPKFTEEILELFRRGVEIIAADDHKFREEDGGCKLEYRNIFVKLQWDLLSCDPGGDGPLDVEEAEQSGHRYEDQAPNVSPSTRASMPRARELHTALKKELRR